MDKLFKTIREFQQTCDINFSILPIDKHSSLIFDFGSYKVEFIFSTKELRMKCIEYLLENHIDLYDYFDHLVEQEYGLTYYKIRD